MPPKRYHVFISHNSKDKAKIADLVKGLQRDGFEVWFDIDDIVAGENWEKQVLKELRDSKVCVVFFSEEGWGPHHLAEVKMAQAISEIRIIPVFLPGAPDNKSLHQIFFEPSGLSEKTTYLDFRSQFNIQSALVLLQKAILGEGKGLDWSVKLERDARNWENKRQSTYSDRLLRDAQEWGKRNPSEVSENGWAFINASLAAQSARLRQIIMGLIFTVSCIASIAIYAFIQRNQAVSKENARATAQANAEEQANARATAQANAETQANIAVSKENARATAQANAEIQANIALARQLAAQSQLISLNARDDTVLSGLLAIESLKRYPSLEGDLAINRVLGILGFPTKSMEIGKVTSMAFSADRKWLVTGNSDGLVQVWDLVAGQERTNLRQNAEIVDVAFSPDKKLIISGDLNNTINVWNEQQMEPINIIRLDGSLGSFIANPDGRSIATKIFLNTGEWVVSIQDISTGFEELRISTDAGNPTPLAFSSDGNLLAIYDVNNNNEAIVSIWDIKLKKEISKLVSNTSGNWINTVQFSDNNMWVAAGDRQGSVHIWNITTGKEILQANMGLPVYDLVFSPNNDLLVGGNFCWRKEICDTNITIWNMNTGQETRKMSEPGGFYDLDISPDGKYLASANGDGTARIWDISTGKELGRMLHPSSVLKVIFSQDGNLLTSVDESGNVKTWWYGSSSAGKYETQENGIRVAAMSPKGDNFVTINYDNIARVRNIATGQEISSVQLKSQVYNLEFSSDGSWVASPYSTEDGSILIWNANTGKEITKISHKGWGSNIAFSPDSRWLASSGNYFVCIWELPSGKEKTCKQFDSTEFPYPPSELAFNPNGKSIAVTLGYSLQILDTDTLQKTTELSGGYATDPTFSPDGKLIATGQLWIGFSSCPECFAHIWDINTSQELATLSHGGRVLSVEFSPNGQWLLTTSQDGTTRVWDVNTGQEVSKMIHNSSVDTATFNHDGSLVMSSSTDGDVRIWEASTGHELARTKLEGASPSQGMQYAGFTNDGKTALLINGSGTIKLWVWQSQDLTTELCTRLYRNMTQDEWKYYFGDEPYSSTCANLQQQ